MHTTISDIKALLDNLDKHLAGKFPAGVPELRNYIFNAHSKLEDWMGVVIIRESFKTVQSSSLEMSLKTAIMSDASIEVNRLLVVMEFHAILKAFLKSVDDNKLKVDLEDKISTVNRIRNEFAHPFGNFLRLYDINTVEGVQNQIKVLKKLYSAIATMEAYLLIYHKEWYLESQNYNRPLAVAPLANS